MIGSGAGGGSSLGRAVPTRMSRRASKRRSSTPKLCRPTTGVDPGSPAPGAGDLVRVARPVAGQPPARLGQPRARAAGRDRAVRRLPGACGDGAGTCDPLRRHRPVDRCSDHHGRDRAAASTEPRRRRHRRGRVICLLLSTVVGLATGVPVAKLSQRTPGHRHSAQQVVVLGDSIRSAASRTGRPGSPWPDPQANRTTTRRTMMAAAQMTRGDEQARRDFSSTQR